MWLIVWSTKQPVQLLLLTFFCFQSPGLIILHGQCVSVHVVDPAVRLENPYTETRFYEPARLSTPRKPLLSLKPLGATTWLRSLLSKVFRSSRIRHRNALTAMVYKTPYRAQAFFVILGKYYCMKRQDIWYIFQLPRRLFFSSPSLKVEIEDEPCRPCICEENYVH